MKMMKKIILLFQFSFLVTVQLSSGDEKTNNFYRRLLNNRYLGLPASAIVGGGIGAGLRYLLHKNTFFSSFRAAEKIKHPTYFKFVGAGMIAGVGLYELLKRLTKPKQSDYDKKKIGGTSPRSRKNSGNNEEEPQKDYTKTIKVTYISPGNLASLLGTTEGLKTKTVSEIERILSEEEIGKYSKNEFWFCSIEDKYSSLTINMFFKNSEYAAALYLINEEQRESFKEKFTKGCSLYDLYKIDKPTSKDNLWCYVLPLESSVERGGNKTYRSEISAEITEVNIDSYSFPLTKEDANHINLNEKEILNADFKSRTNN